MAVDAAAFRARFPAPLFADKDDTAVALAISDAQLLHTRNETAVLYLAAHLLALDSEQTGRPDGGAGVVQKEKIGPRDIQYLTDAGTDERRAFYATTSFGRRFLALEDRTPRVALGAIVA